MAFTAKNSGGSGDWEPVPRGVYQAVCYAVVDLGHQFSQMFGVEQHKAWIAWELPTERIQFEGEDKPRVISKFYTVSLHEKSNLRGDLESWRGRSFTPKELKGFDISKLIGANGQINVIHKENQKGQTRSDVGSIMPLSKGMKKYDSEAEYVYFSFEDHGTSMPENIPDGIKSMIMKSREWNETGQQNDDWRSDNAPPELQDSDPWGESAQNPPPDDDMPPF